MPDQHPPRVGERAPDFTLPDLAGGTVSLHEVNDRHHVVVHFVREFT